VIHEGSYDAAYQGAPGAFSEDAAIEALGGQGRLLSCQRFEEVFDAVCDGRARRGIVPIENTLAGSIHACYDLLVERDLVIVGEVIRRISHALIARPGTSIEGIRRVLSHPVALAQCENFFRRHPLVEAVPVYDTAGAVERVLRTGAPEEAAIAGRRAAEVYGGVVLADALEDHPENFTRFLAIAGLADAGVLADRAPAGYKTSLVFTVANRPGALYECLRHFAERAIDLTKIESRPRRGAPFEYMFYIDLAGHVDDVSVAAALVALERDASVRVLGSYPRHATQFPSQ
jgi:prephenate dehydratase